MDLPIKLSQLTSRLSGDLFFDKTTQIIYATDASAYREIPLAVAIPKTTSDIAEIIRFCHENEISLIPRTAGTSLAGQVVGNGIIVDVSKYFTSILEVNVKENWVEVEPGVIRDELNLHLKPFGFLFGPETSTSNRAMIGGMVGNNSCGANSLVYGSTRDQLLEVTGFLSDGTEVVFGELNEEEFQQKLALPLDNSEGQLYRHIYQLLSDQQKQNQIRSEFPKPEIKRRNTGYALDSLLVSEIFGGNKKFNFCNLISGSEGTLLFVTKIKLRIQPLPPPVQGLVVGHFNSIQESLLANLVALRHQPYAVELMDHHILDCTIGHPLYHKYRFFVKDNPKALLVIQLQKSSIEELEIVAEEIRTDMERENFGYHFPLITGEDVNKVWGLRKAGLGLLANIPGDEKAVPVVEDTCVSVTDLPSYISEFNQLMEHHGLNCVHHAHVGSGELHLRPMINLKTEEGTQLFKTVASEVAQLVKKYNGSLSGEHGDGRLRGEFIPFMVGERIYRDFEELKNTWDPKHIFNPGKIVHSPEMNSHLRYSPKDSPQKVETAFDFSEHGGFLQTVELCNGSADCRKTEITGGIMCPSYMATRDERHTTRARANVLRELMTQRKEPIFNSSELNESMELCLMCKGCKIECPSNVDMATYKSEYLYQKSREKSPGFLASRTARFSDSMKMAQTLSSLSGLIKNKTIQKPIKKILGIHPMREIPIPQKTSLFQWYDKNSRFEKEKWLKDTKKKVYFFCDEFTNFLDVEIGITSLRLLWSLGYDATIIPHLESGRTAISKGFLDYAKIVAGENISTFHSLVSHETPLVGIEPSAILSFRDEYLQLTKNETRKKAVEISSHTFLIDEFISNEFKNGNIDGNLFSDQHLEIVFHGHCHQKSLSSVVHTKKILGIPKNYSVKVIPSGCCGMAGSFGYEHYDVSMKIGELVLFPYLRKRKNKEIVAANGTSCRQQIRDGIGEKALHPVEILWMALKKH
jgi:FAD/FMN-containing dehydrogenase/Fe-S oxidoreductase